jgi:hypothetical protein
VSGNGEERRDPRLRDVLLLGVGTAGLAMCITLMFYGMRSVMDVGGACADGGPFVPAQSCPQGSPAALILGTFGWFGFGALAFVGGALVGGAWAGVGILAWTGLFAALGWNFLDYGLFNPPDGEIVWGWLIPGVMFQVMAFAPLVIGGGIVGSMRGMSVPGAARRSGRPGRAGGVPEVIRMSGPGQPAMQSADAGRAPGPANPGAPVADDAAAPFTEGTQALLDRLERLADMRAQGLLDDSDYETAKDAVLRELEARKQA